MSSQQSEPNGCAARSRLLRSTILGGLLGFGVLLPAAGWYWNALLDRMGRSRTAAIHEEAGDQAYAAGEYSRAMTAYTYARDMSPTPALAQKFIRARLALGSVRPDLVARWDRDDLLYQSAFLAKQDPSLAALSEVISGHLRRQVGDAEGAKERYKAALAVDPESPGAHLGLGLLAYRAGKTDDAKAELEPFVKKFPDHREAVMALADIRLNAGDADGAIELLKRLLEVGPDSEVHHGLGLAYQRKNQVREAASHFQTAVQLNPNARESHMALGNLYLDSELYSLAEVSFRSALSLSQDEAAHVGLARSLNGQKRYDAALQVLSQVLQRSNTGPMAFLAAAEAAEGLGRRDEAVRLYEEVLKFIERLEGHADRRALQALRSQVQQGLERLKAPAGAATTAPKP